MSTRVPPDYERQLDRFRAEGLTNADLAEAGRITREAKPDDYWRYFCGVCWNMITDNMQISHE